MIKKILKEKNIITVFQPVVSLKEMRIIGFEALSRGISSDTGEIIQPMEMFDMARKENCDIELDRLCRKTAMSSFKNIPGFKNFMLFINLDTSIIDRTDQSPETHVREILEEPDLKNSSISIEIVESAIENNQNLINFVDNYKKLGYCVSLDDFGAMHSNMNRIILSKPNIIKIDMGLVRNLHNNYYQQAIITSIIEIAKKTGALTLAEGLENIDDIMKSYELGIDLYQGHFIHRPCVDIAGSLDFIQDKINYTVSYVKAKLQENVTVKKNRHINFESITALLKQESKGRDVERFYQALKENILFYKEIERIFLLDDDGIQIYESIVNQNLKAAKKRSFTIFHENHSDHSLKDYFYYLKNLSSDKYFTDTFISPVTGNILRTMSSRLDINGTKYIMCIDFIDSTNKL